MSHAFGSVEELGDGYGFRKVRQALGVEAFGVNVIVMPPGYEGFFHYHDEQDELYFVHAGTARVEIEGEDRLLGPGGLLHVASTTPRRVSNGGADDLVMLVVGGKDGYVRRDGHLVDEADAERRASFGSRTRALAPAGVHQVRREAPHPRARTRRPPTSESRSRRSAGRARRPAASDAASHGERRRSASPSATSHATNAASPATPVSTPSSV